MSCSLQLLLICETAPHQSCVLCPAGRCCAALTEHEEDMLDLIMSEAKEDEQLSFTAQLQQYAKYHPSGESFLSAPPDGAVAFCPLSLVPCSDVLSLLCRCCVSCHSTDPGLTGACLPAARAVGGSKFDISTWSKARLLLLQFCLVHLRPCLYRCASS